MSQTNQPLRLGILGGTFDPVHTAHIVLALEAKKQLNLDRIFLVPTRPWQKTARASDEDRLRMLQIACRDYPELEIDERELHRAGQSYSIDTLYSFRKQFPTDALFFILGGDQWKNLPTWIQWKHFPDLVNLALFERDEDLFQNPYGSDISVQTVESFNQNPTLNHSIIQLTAPRFDVSSTEIRTALFDDNRFKPIAGLDSKVQDYILEHGLYLPREGSHRI